MKNLDDFYAKEFKLSAEKKSAIVDLNKEYKDKKNTTPNKNGDYDVFENTFDKETNDFNVEAFQRAFQLM